MRTIECAGFLFIGDPHLSSRSPHRRTDSYMAAALDKLDQSIAQANEKDLVAVILGDLFDRPKDTSPMMLCAIMRIFQGAKHKPLTLVGNHDKVASVLTDDTALGVLDASGCIDVMRACGPAALVRTPQAPGGVLLYGVPYGEDIPKDVSRERGKADRVVLVTHHDLAISGASYPGSIEPEEIIGCDLVVNGHDHTTKPHQDVGATRYFNPGNIARVSVAQLRHEPSVFAWDGGADRTLKRHVLDYPKGVFDLTGYQVEQVETASPTADIRPVEPSRFVAMLKEEDQSRTDAAMSEDGREVREEVAAILQEMETSGKAIPPGVRDLLDFLFRESAGHAEAV